VTLTGPVAPVGLEQHLQSVGARARRYGESLGLAEPVLDALEIAGLAHDLGKVDPRFQTLLRRGDWLAAAAADGRMSESLAKTAPGASGMPVPAQWRWPRGMRHEFVSLALVRQARLPDHVDHDLVEHLVASHHGWSRPLFPPVQDDAPRKVSATFQGQELVAQSDDLLTDWSSVDRFSSLCRRFGWWGLALLETCLRLADMAVSEEGS
jgi:CRISPR-associated endonuclease/helicase Cas3